jgi:hypothetical protein
MNTFLDARSNLCYTQVDVEQDHNFDGDGRRAFYGSGGSRLAVMHSFECGEREGMQAKLLRYQNLLRDIAKEHGAAIAAACER